MFFIRYCLSHGKIKLKYIMKNTELRIGNETKQGKVVSFYEKGVHVGFGKCFDFEDLEPIRLNESIFIKLGLYEGFGAGYYHIAISEDNLLEVDVEGNYTIGDDIKPDNSIYHVHELQNLFFALTGIELELQK